MPWCDRRLFVRPLACLFFGTLIFLYFSQELTARGVVKINARNLRYLAVKL